MPLDLPILVLQDMLYQQREQLKETEQRNKLHGAPAFEMRKKAIANLENGIKELEFGIKILTDINDLKLKP